MKNFILSPEYTGQNDNTQFTATMYYALLGRNATAAESVFYVNRLNAGTATREQVLANFLHSPEGVGRVVCLRSLGLEPAHRPPGTIGESISQPGKLGLGRRAAVSGPAGQRFEQRPKTVPA